MSRMKWLIVVLLCTMVYGLWLEEAQCASVVLKSLVVNPSKTKTQKAMLKAYLPKEATPEDIIDLGDLKIDYDITKALYYVYKEFELGPGESVIRQIEIRDIWVITEEELDSLNARAKELAEQLRETAYIETAIGQQRDIREKIALILNKQEKAMDAIPQTHIATYRENVKTEEAIEDILAKLDKMVIETKVAPVVGRISVKATWWVILAVIISLGIISLVFFIIWQRQAIKQKEEETKE